MLSCCAGRGRAAATVRSWLWDHVSCAWVEARAETDMLEPSQTNQTFIARRLGRPGSVRPIRMHAELTLALRQLSELQRVRTNPNPTTRCKRWWTNGKDGLTAHTNHSPIDDAHVPRFRGIPTGGRDRTGKLRVVAVVAMGSHRCCRAGGAISQRARRIQRQACNSRPQVSVLIPACKWVFCLLLNASI